MNAHSSRRLRAVVLGHVVPDDTSIGVARYEAVAADTVEEVEKEKLCKPIVARLDVSRNYIIKHG